MINSVKQIYKYLDDKYNYIPVVGLNRNPVRRLTNNVIIGNLLQESVFLILKNYGLYDEVKTTELRGNGIDVIARNNGKDKLAIEVTNLALTSYWCNRKIDRTINNFVSSNAKVKIIFTTFVECVSEEKFRDLNVEFIELGYQPLPKTFYEFAKINNQANNRKAFSIEVLKDIERALINFIIDYNNKQATKYLDNPQHTVPYTIYCIDINKQGIISNVEKTKMKGLWYPREKEIIENIDDYNLLHLNEPCDPDQESDFILGSIFSRIEEGVGICVTNGEGIT